MPRKIFVIEGADFAGKSLASMILVDRLQDKYSIDKSFEPGGTPYAVSMSQLLKSEQGLSNLTYLFGMLSARADHLNRRIKKSFEDNIDFMLLDRFELSTYVYQVLYQSGEPTFEKLKDVFFSTRELLLADQDIEFKYIFLDVSSEVAAKRKQHANPDERTLTDAIEEKYNNHQKLRACYGKALETFIEKGIITREDVCTINTDFLLPEEVVNVIETFIEKSLR